jgi:putative ABC transport system ATP-binding protein
MLELTNVSKTFHPGTVNAKKVLRGLDLHLNPGDFVTVIGGNGAGKSTLLNAIAGVWAIDEGSIKIDGIEVSKIPEYKRAKYIGRVFQDPVLGTATTMEIQENLAISARRGEHRTLRWGISSAEKKKFRELLSILELGLEDRMNVKVGLLSGGQRQALTLLMATMNRPKILLLDEHTAALDPKTAAKVLEISDKLICENNLTALMVTHNMRDAIAHGNRLIMMDRGKIILDISGEEKKKLTVETLLEQFTKTSGKEFVSDRALLS